MSGTSVHHTHTIYQPSDFTLEEIRRKNELAVMVIVEGASICMICGEFGEDLVAPCKRAACPKHHTGAGPCYCGKEGE